MFTNKQEEGRMITGQAKRGSKFRWSMAAGALLLTALYAGPVRAQDSTDSVPRTGDKPDTTVKKDSVPVGAKTKQTDKKPAKAPPAKPTGKDAKKVVGKNNNKNGYVSKRIVLVFPVDAKGAAAEQLSDIITDVEKARLSATGAYGPISFLPSLPAVRRSLNEQSLTPADITPPFATTFKAQRLTSRLLATMQQSSVRWILMNTMLTTRMSRWYSASR